MFCKYCGYKLADDANFCPKCGKLVLEPEPEITTAPIQEKSIAEDQVTALEPVYIEQEEEPVYYVEPNEMELSPEVEAEKKALGSKVLTWGILALVFAETVILSLLGLIFAECIILFMLQIVGQILLGNVMSGVVVGVFVAREIVAGAKMGGNGLTLARQHVCLCRLVGKVGAV